MSARSLAPTSLDRPEGANSNSYELGAKAVPSGSAKLGLARSPEPARFVSRAGCRNPLQDIRDQHLRFMHRLVEDPDDMLFLGLDDRTDRRHSANAEHTHEHPESYRQGGTQNDMGGNRVNHDNLQSHLRARSNPINEGAVATLGMNWAMFSLWTRSLSAVCCSPAMTAR